MTDELMTTTEFSTWSKYKTSTIRAWCREGILPAVRLGNQYRIRVADAKALLENKGLPQES